MEAMTKDRKIQKMNLSFAKTVAYGGDGMNQEWEDEMSKFLKSHQASYGLMKGYGMTEMADLYVQAIINFLSCFHFSVTILRY